jgi:radical SAM superfamily enzyme with C-terminal helix-hairpin-helix motif
LKHRFEFRDEGDILEEIGAFYSKGTLYFRIGKQSCFYSHPNAVSLLKKINERFPKIKVLHIDNVNPVAVLGKKGKEITKAIVENCTPGNIAAFGVESFDEEVRIRNNLNCSAEDALTAIRIINELGKEMGENGMPRFLPGINIVLGLNGESKKTFEKNFEYLKKILDEGLLLRRINIRQVSIFEGTDLFNTVGNRFLKKNKKFYWKFREKVRQEIDFPMLQRLVPKGTILRGCRAEIYDGKTTFLRQIGTYPLIIGVKGRVPLKQFYNVKITSHMLRSITGEIVS